MVGVRVGGGGWGGSGKECEQVLHGVVWDDGEGVLWTSGRLLLEVDEVGEPQHAVHQGVEVVRLQ